MDDTGFFEVIVYITLLIIFIFFLIRFFGIAKNVKEMKATMDRMLTIMEKTNFEGKEKGNNEDFAEWKAANPGKPLYDYYSRK